MTKREKAKLRKAVEESWAGDDGTLALGDHRAIAAVCDPKYKAAFTRWRNREEVIVFTRYVSWRRQAAEFRKNDFRLLKEIGA